MGPGQEILINGRFLVQPQTGVQRVSREFTMAADRLLASGAFPAMKLRLIAPQGADFAPLGLTEIATEHLSGGSSYFWEQLSLVRGAGGQPLISLGNSAPIVSLLTSKRVAVMIHDQSYRLFPGDYSRGYRFAHSLMDRVILRRAMPLFTVSHTEAAAIRAANPSMVAKLVVAPNGSWIRDAATPPAARTACGGFGLSVGGFSHRKNFAGAFRTAVALAERGVGFRFVGAPTLEAQAMLANAGDAVRRHVHYLGYVSNVELAKLYNEAAFLLFPSFYEASGLPASEAMHFGCPVITSDLAVMRERCGDSALYCDPHDATAMITAALQILENPSLAADLSSRGRHRAAIFTWQAQAEIILRSVAELCALPSG